MCEIDVHTIHTIHKKRTNTRNNKRNKTRNKKCNNTCNKRVPERCHQKRHQAVPTTDKLWLSRRAECLNVLLFVSAFVARFRWRFCWRLCGTLSFTLSLPLPSLPYSQSTLCTHVLVSDLFLSHCLHRPLPAPTFQSGDDWRQFAIHSEALKIVRQGM